MEQFQEIAESIRQAVEQENWYAALALALAAPDICGKVDSPALGSQARYAAWFDTYLGENYRRPLGHNREMHTFMSGTDCYALRCAFLHAGNEDIAGNAQAVRDALDRFHFLRPTAGNRVHNNQFGRILQLQVDVFCLEIAQGVENWLRSPVTRAILDGGGFSLLKIYNLDQSVWDPATKVVGFGS